MDRILAGVPCHTPPSESGKRNESSILSGTYLSSNSMCCEQNCLLLLLLGHRFANNNYSLSIVVIKAIQNYGNVSSRCVGSISLVKRPQSIRKERNPQSATTTTTTATKTNAFPYVFFLCCVCNYGYYFNYHTSLHVSKPHPVKLANTCSSTVCISRRTPM